MSKFDIDVDDMIKFFKEAGFEIVDAKPGEEGGLYIGGKLVDPVEALREAFETPITASNNKSIGHNSMEAMKKEIENSEKFGVGPYEKQFWIGEDDNLYPKNVENTTLTNALKEIKEFFNGLS